MSSDRTIEHVKIDHNFEHSLLSYDTGVHYQRADPSIHRICRPLLATLLTRHESTACVKISLFFNKRDDVSYAHFHKHWATVHADLTIASAPFRIHNLQRYTQHHQTPETKATVQRVGHKLLDFDGCSTMWVRSWDDYERFITSTEYAGLAADCDHFLDVDTITVFAG
jgi:hypothetical protein